MTVEQQMTNAGDASVSDGKVNGPVIAATLAAGIGSFALGILTILGEASTSIKDSLTFSDSVGTLSGKTTVAVVIYVASWGILHAALKDRDLPWKPFFVVTAVLVGLALLFTFQPFFALFAAEE